MGIKSFLFMRVLNYAKQQQLQELEETQHLDVLEVRRKVRIYNDFKYKFHTPRKDVTILDDVLDDMFCYHAFPKEFTKRVILYLHGGGYTLSLKSQSNTFKYFSAELAHVASAEVYAIEYSLAPEHPFPAALEDAYKAYLALLAKGIDPKNIYITGDSAGGGLTIALLMKIRDEGTPMARAAFPISPWTDLACTGESMNTRAHMDPMLTPGGIKDTASVVLNGQSATDPYASPLYGNYEDLPPMMIFVGGRDILFDDSLRVCDKAKKAGVNITLDVKESMMHVYPLFGGIFKESNEAIERMANFINKNSKS